MQRIVDQQYAEAIGEAYSYIPDGLLRYAKCEFFTGCSPRFAGIHNYPDTPGEPPERSYDHVSHFYEAEYQLMLPKSLRAHTIFLPHMDDPWSIVHELGHAIHANLDYIEVSCLTTEYAGESEYEAFAEAFTEYCMPGYGDILDEYTRDLFEHFGEVPYL